MEVHRELGSGLRELPYENALRNELRYRKHQVDQQKAWPIQYKGAIEVKAINALGDEELSQVLNYLRISKMRLGLILNFKPSSLEVERVAL